MRKVYFFKLFDKKDPWQGQTKTANRLSQKQGLRQGHKQKRQTVYFRKKGPQEGSQTKTTNRLLQKTTIAFEPRK